MSHGEIAFGFFNIETDMLLLDRYFFFASDFCSAVSQLGATRTGCIEAIWSVYILDEKNIGNLTAAIRGIEFTGFIGDIYRLFPFPGEKRAFKQNPEGWKTRDAVEKMIVKHAPPSAISVKVEASGSTIAIGEYLFSGLAFHELLQYVWMGGYPRWKEEVRPGYVRDMKAVVEKSVHPLFGIQIED